MFKQHENLLIWTWIFVYLTMGVNSYTNRNLCKNSGLSILLHSVISLPDATSYDNVYLYSNKKDTSDFHGTVSFDPIKMSQQKIYQNVYQTSDTPKLVIIWFYLLIWKSYWTLSENSSFHFHQQVDHQNVTHFTFNGNQKRQTMKKHLKFPNVLIKRAALQFKIVNLRSKLKLPPFALNK